LIPNPKFGILKFVWPTPVLRYARKEKLFSEAIDKVEGEIKKELNQRGVERLSKGYQTQF
jgi:hypothetical protein